MLNGNCKHLSLGNQMIHIERNYNCKIAIIKIIYLGRNISTASVQTSSVHSVDNIYTLKLIKSKYLKERKKLQQIKHQNPDIHVILKE